MPPTMPRTLPHRPGPLRHLTWKLDTLSRLVDGRPHYPRLAQVPGSGLVFHIDSDTDKQRAIGLTELDELQAFLTNCPMKRVWDLGACHGLYSLHALAYGAREVHAWEPHPAEARKLELNMRLNTMQHYPLHIHRAAVMDTTNYRLETIPNRATRVVQGDNPGLEIHTPKDLPPKPDLAKIDVEGAECVVIPALHEAGLLPDQLLLEIHPSRLSVYGDPSPMHAVLDDEYGHYHTPNINRHLLFLDRKTP